MDSPLKQRLYQIIFEADTRLGKLFDVVLLLLILASIAVVMLESVIHQLQPYASMVDEPRMSPNSIRCPDMTISPACLPKQHSPRALNPLNWPRSEIPLSCELPRSESWPVPNAYC